MKQSIAGIIYSQGQFLIGHRIPVGEMGNRWEFPGGKVDPGETPHETIIREFKEEMGVTVSIGELITTVEFSNRNGTVQLLAYRVFFPSHEEVILTEHSEIKWATLHEIEQMVFVDSDKLLFPYLKKWSSDEKSS